MSDFNKALALALKNEGGYANDPHDPGRETYCGISRRFWPHWDGWKLLDEYQVKYGTLKINEVISYSTLEADVAEFYLNIYWLPLKCDKIVNVPLAESLFDFGINIGRIRAVRILQKTVNAHAGRRRLKVDGRIGHKTLAGVEAACMASAKFPDRYMIARIQFYLDLCQAAPRKYRYLENWVMRSLKSLEI